jgi:hypothetical protein
LLLMLTIAIKLLHIAGSERRKSWRKPRGRFILQIMASYFHYLLTRKFNNRHHWNPELLRRNFFEDISKSILMPFLCYVAF